MEMGMKGKRPAALHDERKRDERLTRGVLDLEVEDVVMGSKGICCTPGGPEGAVSLSRFSSIPSRGQFRRKFEA